MWVAAGLVGLSASCKQEGSSADASPTASAVAAASAASDLRHAEEPGALAPGELDPCIVGKWKTVRVALENAQVDGSGGANLSLDVLANGQATIDFDPMTPISATAAPTTFDFSYSGQSTAHLATPRRGTLEVTRPDYSKVKVTAKVSIPGAGSIQLFKDTPIRELLQATKSAAEADDDLPLPEPSGPPPTTIDPSPVFSASAYECAGNALAFKGPAPGAAWYLERAK